MNPFNPVTQTQFQGWASFYGGNVQAPAPPPPSAFGSAALGQPPSNGQYTGGWAYPDAWANFYEGNQGFQAPQNQNTPAGALAATEYGNNVNNPNDPNLLGWEQAYGNPNTILSQDTNWAQSLGNAPTSTPSGQLTGGWQNPEAWSAYYGGTNGFTAPANAGSPASALAAASQIAATSNPQTNPALLGWVQDYGQPGSVLANTPNWAASLGTPQVNAQGQDIGETNTQGWNSPLAWAAYYGGFQGFNNNAPQDNTLQAAQNWAGVTNANDPSLLGWELDYGNPQTVVSTIEASPAYQQYQTELAQYQAAQQAAAAAAANPVNQKGSPQWIAANMPGGWTSVYSGTTKGGVSIDTSDLVAKGIWAINFSGGYEFYWGPGTNFQEALNVTGANYGGSYSGPTYGPVGGGGGGGGGGGPVAPIFNDSGLGGFTIPEGAYQAATSGLVLGGGSYTGYVPGAFADSAINPLSNDVIGTNIAQFQETVSPDIGGIVAPTVGSFIAPIGYSSGLSPETEAAFNEAYPGVYQSLLSQQGAVTPEEMASLINQSRSDVGSAALQQQSEQAAFTLGAPPIPLLGLGGLPQVDTGGVPSYTPPIGDFENPSGPTGSDYVSVDDYGRPIPDVGPPQPFSVPDFGSLITQDLPPLQLPASWTAPATSAPDTSGINPNVTVDQVAQSYSQDFLSQAQAGTLPDLSALPNNNPQAIGIAVSPGAGGKIPTQEVSPTAFPGATDVPDVNFGPYTAGAYTGSYAPPADVFTDPNAFGADTLYQGGYGQPVQDQLPPPQPFSTAEQFVQKYGSTTTLRQILSDATPDMLKGYSLSTVLWALGKGVDTPIDLTQPDFMSQLKSALDAGGGWRSDQVISGLTAAMKGGPQAITDAAQDLQQDKAEGAEAYGQLGYTTAPVYGTPQPMATPPAIPQAATPNPVPPADIPYNNATAAPPASYDLGAGFGSAAPAPSFSYSDLPYSFYGEPPSGIQAGYSYLPGSFGEIDPYNFSSAPYPAGGYGGGSPDEMPPEAPAPGVQYGQPVSEVETQGVSPQAFPTAPDVPTMPTQGEEGIPQAPPDMFAQGSPFAGAPGEDLSYTPGTMAFLQGMTSRYARFGGTVEQLEADARAVADQLGLNFRTIGPSGDDPQGQLAAIKDALNNGYDISAIMGFSQGANTLNKIQGQYPGYQYIPIAGSNPNPGFEIPGVGHMNQVAMYGDMLSDQSGEGFGPAAQTTSTPNTDFSYLEQYGGHATDLIGQPTNIGSEVGGYSQTLADRLEAAGRAYQAATGQDPVYGEADRGPDIQSVYYEAYKHGLGLNPNDEIFNFAGAGGGIAAPPGASMHNQNPGQAMDLPSSGFRDWLKAGNAANFGINFPVPGDAPHAQAIPNWQGTLPAVPAAPIDQSGINPGVTFDQVIQSGQPQQFSGPSDLSFPGGYSGGDITGASVEPPPESLPTIPDIGQLLAPQSSAGYAPPRGGTIGAVLPQIMQSIVNALTPAAPPTFDSVANIPSVEPTFANTVAPQPLESISFPDYGELAPQPFTSPDYGTINTPADLFGFGGGSPNELPQYYNPFTASDPRNLTHGMYPLNGAVFQGSPEQNVIYAPGNTTNFGDFGNYVDPNNRGAFNLTINPSGQSGYNTNYGGISLPWKGDYNQVALVQAPNGQWQYLPIVDQGPNQTAASHGEMDILNASLGGFGYQSRANIPGAGWNVQVINPQGPFGGPPVDPFYPGAPLPQPRPNVLGR